MSSANATCKIGDEGEGVDWSRGGPVGALGGQVSVSSFSVCRCKMHVRSQLDVPAGLGCWKTAVGNHAAVQDAEKGLRRGCHVKPEVRKKDKKFYDFVMGYKHGVMSYQADWAFSFAWKKYATGASGLDDFGRGYCHLLGLKSGFENRVARVWGPNMYVSDYLKVLCVGGKCSMVPLDVTLVAPGYLHVEQQKGGFLSEHAGKVYYDTLVEHVKHDKFVRIGATVEMPRTVVVSSAVKMLQFGSVPLEWNYGIQLRVIEVVRDNLGVDAAMLLLAQINSKVGKGSYEDKKRDSLLTVQQNADKKHAKNVKSRYNKKMVKQHMKGNVELLGMATSVGGCTGNLVDDCGYDLIEL